MSNAQAPAADWQLWAFEQLGLAAEAPAVEVRTAILTKLEEAEFAPEDQLSAAVRLGLTTLEPGDPPGGALAAFARARRQALAESVEEFAQRYWSLAPADRQRAHAQLWAAASSAPLIRLRLEGLREGLRARSITAPEEHPAEVLAVMVQECYVLPPMDRAVRRQELVAFIGSEGGGSLGLEQLETAYPHLIRLEPALNVEPLAPPVRKKLKRLKRYDDVVPAGKKQAKNRALWWVVFVIFVGLSRLAGLSNGPSTNTPPYQPVRDYSVPQVPPLPATVKPAGPVKTDPQSELMKMLLQQLRQSSESAAEVKEKLEQSTPGTHRPPDQGKRSGGGKGSRSFP